MMYEWLDTSWNCQDGRLINEEVSLPWEEDSDDA